MLFWPELKKCLLAIIIIFPIYITTTVVNGLVRVFIAIYFKFTKYSFAPSLDNVLQILSLNSTIVTVLYTDQGSTKVDMVQEKEFVQTSILNKLDGNGDKINKKLRYVWCKKVRKFTKVYRSNIFLNLVCFSLDMVVGWIPGKTLTLIITSEKSSQIPENI